jgi:hypothetical protein
MAGLPSGQQLVWGSQTINSTLVAHLAVQCCGGCSHGELPDAMGDGMSQSLGARVSHARDLRTLGPSHSLHPGAT